MQSLPGSCFLHPKGASPRLPPEAGLYPELGGCRPGRGAALHSPQDHESLRQAVPGGRCFTGQEVALPWVWTEASKQVQRRGAPLTGLPPSLFPPRSKASCTDGN